MNILKIQEIPEYKNKLNKNHRVTIPKQIKFSKRFMLNDWIHMNSGERLSYDNWNELLSSINNESELNDVINNISESYIPSEYYNEDNFYPDNTADFHEAVMQLHYYLHNDN